MWRCKHCEPNADADGDEAGDSGGVWNGCMGSSSSKNPDELPDEVRGYLIIICDGISAFPSKAILQYSLLLVLSGLMC